jgi:hypothetical protein
MALQYSVAVNNARLDAFETTAGTAAHLKIYTGTVPANCAAAATGTLLVDMTLPSDWMNNAASGVKTKLGTWSGTGAAAGTAGYARITDSAGTTTHLQGSCGTSGTDFILDNTSIAVSQVVTVNTFQITAANT